LIFSFSIVIGVFNTYSNLPTGRVFVPLPGGTTSFSRRKRKQNGSALNIYAVFYAPGFAGAQSTPHRLRRFADCLAQPRPAKTFLLKTTHKSSRPLPFKTAKSRRKSHMQLIIKNI
jgi:hypothetical protein